MPFTRTSCKRLIFIAVALAAAAALFLLNPTDHAFIPKCPFKLVTGFDCPGCGFQRAVHALLHGRIAEAWAYNRFLVYSVPYLVCVMLTEWVWKGKRKERWQRIFEGRVAIGLYIALFFAWGIFRNIADC